MSDVVSLVIGVVDEWLIEIVVGSVKWKGNIRHFLSIEMTKFIILALMFSK